MDVVTWLDDLRERDEALRTHLTPESSVADLDVLELRARLRSAGAEIAFRDAIMAGQASRIHRLEADLAQTEDNTVYTGAPSVDNMLRYYAKKSPAPVALVLNGSASGVRFALTKAQALAAKVRR